MELELWEIIAGAIASIVAAVLGGPKAYRFVRRNGHGNGHGQSSDILLAALDGATFAIKRMIETQAEANHLLRELLTELRAGNELARGTGRRIEDIWDALKSSSR